ncbi:MAG: Bax inhibitor-1/YccA family protein [Chloroflexi bacterium]|nr:Bax inhibitor-1/YccA family protein [Chloroflexota bacterium]
MFNNDPNRTNQYGQSQPQGWDQPSAAPNTLSDGVRVGAASVPRQGFLTASFVWMFVGLLLSAGAGLFVMNNEQALQQVVNNWIILIIAELGLVLGLSFLITRLNPMVALGAFFVYALLNGLTLGVIVLAYMGTTAGVSGVVTAFLGASAIFAGAAIYGYATKRDLTSLGGILFMGLIGLIVVMIAQMFLFPGDAMINIAIGVVGVVLFTGLTAYHVQQLKAGAVEGINADSASVMGALVLYLAFVNLFLFLLRIFGSNR